MSAAAATRDLAALPGARRAPLPGKIVPQLATLSAVVPKGDGWLHEMKLDGYRILCRVVRGRATLFTRTGQDWTARFREIADEAARLPVRAALLDGEAAVLEPDGTTSFQSLQNFLKLGRERERLRYFVFDLLHLDGVDLRGVPLEVRKQALARVLAGAGRARKAVLRYNDHVVGRGEEFFAHACRHHLEGMVSKLRDSVYQAGRNASWLKVKCLQRQEFVIGGYTDPQGARLGLGSLLVGVRDARGLHYAGRVGTGFDHDLLIDLERRLRARTVATSPFYDTAGRLRGTHWVKPELVAEVAFSEWTKDGRLRHPAFQGLREDKPADQVVAERPAPAAAAQERHAARYARAKPAARPKPATRRTDGAGEARVAGVAITHPDKVLYPEQGVRKLELARYLEAVAPRMLAEVKGRPLMLLRCPEGARKQCFYQKHPGMGTHPSLDQVEIAEKTARAKYLVARDATGLVALVQMGALEVHVWGSRVERLERPDRMVFDIDPDPSTPWPQVIATALRLRELLAGFDLESFVKTTGGKGLHVVVPLRRGPDWDQMRTFSGAVALRLVAEAPERYTTQLMKDRRHGRIFVDTMRNLRGHTWVAPYSPRAREGAPVSLPIPWSEVAPRLAPLRFNVQTVPGMLRRHDPWSGIDAVRQTITAAMLRDLARAAAPRPAR